MKLNFGSLFGDKDLESLLTKIDTTIGSIPIQNSINADSDVYSSEVIRNVINSYSKSGESDFESLLNNITIASGRLDRYKIYDEIYSSTQIIKKICWVYANNILQKDAINTNAIIIKENTDSQSEDINEDTIKPYKVLAERVIQHFQLEKQLAQVIVPDMLRYGDHYVEVIDLKEDIMNLPDSQSMPSRNIISENSRPIPNNKISSKLNYIEERLNINGKSHDDNTRSNTINDVIKEITEIFINEIEDKPILDPYEQIIYENYSNNPEISLTEATNNSNISPKDKEDSENKYNLNRVLLKFHKPHNIVVLSTPYGNILGYVEVRETVSTERTLGVGARFASLVQKITTLYSNVGVTNELIIRRIVDTLILKVLAKSKIKKKSTTSSGKSDYENNKEYEELLNQQLGDNLFYFVKKMYFENNSADAFNWKKLSARFIPADRMVPFCLNPIEFDIYGTSIIDKTFVASYSDI